MTKSDEKPKARDGLDCGRLDLSGEEGFLLSRIDGATSVRELELLTGLTRERVNEILDRLESAGAIELPGRPNPSNMRQRSPDGCQDDADDPDGPFDESEDDEGLNDAAGSSGAEKAASLRRIYSSELSSLDLDRRLDLARSASGDLLLALCLDPSPRVIAAILDNPKSEVPHVRLIAEHHRTASGLEHLGRAGLKIRDSHTQRMLFRNPLLPETLFDRLMKHKRVSDAYKLAVSRDVIERVRTQSRRAFRGKFIEGTSEERVAIIFSTEGRCLSMLVGVPLDGRAAAIIAGRSIHSTLLVQNLARWSATPPAVLVHLAKQPLVRRAPALRALLIRHPNAPSSLKHG